MVNSLLPNSILPPNSPIGTVWKDGQVTGEVTMMEQNWWLFFYNLAQQVLGVGNVGLPASALIELGALDTDVSASDTSALRQPVSNLAEVLSGLGEPEVDAFALRRPVSNALLLAQDTLLPDPVNQAQPVLSVTLGASPAAYTAPFDGTVVITGGTVTIITLTRQGTAVATGLTTGIIPVARRDIVTVTYAVLPTVTFIPS